MFKNVTNMSAKSKIRSAHNASFSISVRYVRFYTLIYIFTMIRPTLLYCGKNAICCIYKHRRGGFIGSTLTQGAHVPGSHKALTCQAHARRSRARLTQLRRSRARLTQGAHVPGSRMGSHVPGSFLFSRKLCLLQIVIRIIKSTRSL